MAFIGVLFMIQGFGALIAEYFFDRTFGLLQFVLDGTAHTAGCVALGVVGLVMVLASGRKALN